MNVLGLMICTRESVKSMRERNVDDGYIIHVGRYIQSIFGFEINEQLCANVCLNVHVHVCVCNLYTCTEFLLPCVAISSVHIFAVL